MPITPAIEQLAHDQLNEANLLLLEMMLPGSKASGEAAELVARLRDCADQSCMAGMDKTADQLRRTADMLESEAAKRDQ